MYSAIIEEEKNRKSILSISNLNPFSSEFSKRKVSDKPMPKAVGAKLLWMAIQDKADIANDLKDVLCEEIYKILSDDIFAYEDILEDMVHNIDQSLSIKRTFDLLRHLIADANQTDLEKLDVFFFKTNGLNTKVIQTLQKCVSVEDLSTRLDFLAFFF